jgi:peptide-methionine (S)-S-oxide reductase
MTKRFFLALALAAAACGQGSADQADAAPQAPRPLHVQRAIFAGGCFWSAETDIEHVPGVVEAVSGFTGGTVPNPSYEQVSGGGTGHVEAVLVTFDPARISYGQLVRRFFRTIDPTDPEGQFCDRGANYRTAIFAMNPAQEREAQAARAEANRILHGRVVTPVRRSGPFYRAETYHQDYARLHPVAYGMYRRGCGRDARLREVWGSEAGAH